jgi:hexosaminidase
LAGLFALLPACGRDIATEPEPPPPDLQRYALIPWPQRIEPRSGDFSIDEGTRVVLSEPVNAELQSIAALVTESLRAATGIEVPVAPASGAEGTGNTIALRLSQEGEPVSPEEYRLSVAPTGVILSANTPAGLFYGAQTLRQLIPLEGAGRAIPAVEIKDAPRFTYRGMHLDVGRHLFPVSFIKKYIDLLATYKINTFHWHLTEDQGWRIEIKRYPKLTQIGAYRKETRVGHAHQPPEVYDGTPYGGFYTQAEIREIVAYARQRYVTIIPEIEMPGHSRAALAAYPELACTAGPFTVATTWGVFDDIYCPKEETFQFLENVLAEVMDLFPGTYIHIGGDEAPKKRWEESPAAQAVIQREALKDEHELQSYFIRRIEKFLNAHGRRLIGWDEILEGGLAPTATVGGGPAGPRRDHDTHRRPLLRPLPGEPGGRAAGHWRVH